jgi:hypothetical protein
LCILSGIWFGFSSNVEVTAFWEFLWSQPPLSDPSDTPSVIKADWSWVWCCWATELIWDIARSAHGVGTLIEWRNAVCDRAFPVAKSCFVHGYMEVIRRTFVISYFRTGSSHCGNSYSSWISQTLVNVTSSTTSQWEHTLGPTDSITIKKEVFVLNWMTHTIDKVRSLLWWESKRKMNHYLCWEMTKHLESAEGTVVHQIAGRDQIPEPLNSDTRKIWPYLKIGTSIEHD